MLSAFSSALLFITETIYGLLKRLIGNVTERAEVQAESRPTRPTGLRGPPPPPQHRRRILTFHQSPISIHISIGDGSPPQILSSSKFVHTKQSLSLLASNSRGDHYGSMSDGQKIIFKDLGIFALYYGVETALKYKLSESPLPQLYDASTLIASAVQLKKQIGWNPEQQQYIEELERDVIGPAQLVVSEQIEYLKSLSRPAVNEKIA